MAAPKNPRRSKLLTDREVQRRAVELAGRGFTILAISKAVGVKNTTLAQHRDAIPGFNEAFDGALNDRIDRLGASCLEVVEHHNQQVLAGKEPKRMAPAVVVAGLRAVSSRFAASQSQVEHTGRLSFGELVDEVMEERKKGERPSD